MGRSILFSKKEGLWDGSVIWNTGVPACVCYKKWNKCEQALQWRSVPHSSSASDIHN